MRAANDEPTLTILPHALLASLLSRCDGNNKANSGVLMFGRSPLFNRAMTACGKLRARHPDNVTIKSIISQLNYLIEVEAGRTKDRSRLDTIVIGVLARREIEPLDTKTAKLLQKVADEARKMETASPEARR